MSQDRRTFLGRSSRALSAAAVGAAVPTPSAASKQQAARLDAALLEAVAGVVLPSELGADGVHAAAEAFAAWADGYEPVAELNHGYGTSEIRYGRPDPVPGWTAQLEALDLEARQREGVAFVELTPAARRSLLERQDLDRGGALPNPLAAGHVAVALMAHWFRSPDATDRCYGRAIGERSCRGIDSARAEPDPVR